MTDHTARHWTLPTDIFLDRHVGTTGADVREMLGILGFPSLEALIRAAVPEDLRLRDALHLPAPRSEPEDRKSVV